MSDSTNEEISLCKGSLHVVTRRDPATQKNIVCYFYQETENSKPVQVYPKKMLDNVICYSSVDGSLSVYFDNFGDSIEKTKKDNMGNVLAIHRESSLQELDFIPEKSFISQGGILVSGRFFASGLTYRAEFQRQNILKKCTYTFKDGTKIATDYVLSKNRGYSVCHKMTLTRPNGDVEILLYNKNGLPMLENDILANGDRVEKTYDDNGYISKIVHRFKEGGEKVTEYQRKRSAIQHNTKKTQSPQSVQHNTKTTQSPQSVLEASACLDSIEKMRVPVDILMQDMVEKKGGLHENAQNITADRAQNTALENALQADTLAPVMKNLSDKSLG